MPHIPTTMRATLRASRLILVAIVALFGLTGVREPVSGVPFGAAPLVEEYGPLGDIWKNLREQMVADDEANQFAHTTRCWRLGRCARNAYLCRWGLQGLFDCEVLCPPRGRCAT